MTDASGARLAFARGAWCVVDRDYGETITAVYLTELEALRAINDRGFGRVAFVKWGETLTGEKP